MKIETRTSLRAIVAAGLVGMVFAGGANSASAWQSRGSYGTQQPTQRQGPIAPGAPGTPNPMDIGRGPDTDGMIDKIEGQQAKTRNTERQRRLQADTEKLLSLATDLKQQVDKTDKNILSIDVIKKADEIEKLAKSVKERMKG
ncbi:MAG: hypothetical protein JWM43_3681 [Acidobacteriaceae bacterium]|nr:hypothetical protein [Acidobacteriaceae bacterium]